MEKTMPGSAKDHIIFPLDLPTADDAKRYIEMLCEDVGIFKIGLELFIDSGPDIVRFVNSTGTARVFLDLKLHDIPATVHGAMKRIASLDVFFTTVHCGENIQMLEAAVKGAGSRVGVLGVTVLTSVSGNDLKTAGFMEPFWTSVQDLVIKRAKSAKKAGCRGIVCSGREAGAIKSEVGSEFQVITPGIRPAWEDASNDDQQRITTPFNAIKNGSDYLVIGRPIRNANAPQEAAKKIADEIETALCSCSRG